MSDKEIVEGCIRNDRKFQRILYERFAPQLFAVCIRYAGNRQDAEDILQDGLIKVYASIKNFRSEGSLEGWIRRIVINTALGHIRKQKQSVLEHHDEITDQHTEASHEGDILERISATEITNMISTLPYGYRTVFNLNVVDGYSHREIADIMQITESTSRSQLTKARNMLRNKIRSITEVYHG